MYKTEQENFWAGSFGDEYITRNCSNKLLASNISFFSDILNRTSGVSSVIEFGANIGLNLKAIKTLLPDIKCSAIEINSKAANILKNDRFFNGEIEVINDTILNTDFFGGGYDLCLIRGVLIHINPDELNSVYEKLYRASNKYICISEYYNPTPVTVSYRGNQDRLFKRDFAGEFLDKYKDCSLVDYGFKYHRDSNFPQDDTTWFLIKKA